MGYRDGLKSAYVRLDALTALRTPVSALLGVSNEAELTLNELGIFTVYDLASSSLFNNAAEVAAAADGKGSSAIARLGRVPGSFIDRDSPATPDALVQADIAMLREIGQQLAAAIKSQMHIDTVGDLGRWPPFRAAKVILDASMPSVTADGIAEELVPKLGEYPTERHYYRSVVIDHVIPGETTDLSTAGPIDISPTVASNFGFSAPAVGAILTFAQSWFAQGMTLGNMLHSIALAPGESTRIAVLDWARRTAASGTETISESEQLSNTATHNRAISEVQEAVAHEVQSGFSRTSGSSTTDAGGGGFGLSLGPLTLGGSGSTATSTSNAESFSSSSGTRDLAATMNQRISDSTQQAASSVRDRRASIVKEVSEEEHQSVSTRIIANYNHMHALTVQYFEVIEIYRVNVQLHQVERCLFVPMKLVDFTDTLIERYQGVLASAAMTRRARELLSVEFGTVSIQPAVKMKLTDNIFDRVTGMDRMAMNIARTARMPSSGSDAAPGIEGASPSPAVSQPAASAVLTAPAPLAWMKDEISRAARITLVSVTKPGKNAAYLPGTTELVGITFALSAQNDGAAVLNTVELIMQNGAMLALTALSPVDWSVPDGIPLQEIDQIRVTSANASYLAGRMTLQLIYGSTRFPITIPVEINPHATAQPLCRIAASESRAELRVHLEQNRLYYSQAIWRALDPSNIALLLSSYTFEGRPVADQIDPNPVMTASNYLVFRMPGFLEAAGINPARARAEDENTAEAAAYKNWQKWLSERGLILGADAANEQLIPVPTSGVFAEAVLGRSNSAEPLDATRFWNWQDSPIPLQPPEIAAIQMESRAQPVDVTPGQLSPPVVNIMNPASLPDPSGINSIIGAMQNGNMFRDMAGLATTAGMAQALASNATTAGTEAGKQAAANLAVAAQKDIEEKRIAAQLAMAAMGLPAASSGTPKNISESGALLNTATKMDKQSQPARMPATATESAGGMSGVGAGSGSSTGGGVDEDTGSFDDSFMPGVPGFMNGNADSRADNVLSKMTWGNLGISGNDVMLAAAGRTKTGVRTGTSVIIYELACYANFPRPWADEAAEIQAIQNGNWLPASEDFDAISKAATSATSATKPYGQVMSTLQDIIQTVTYFAPQAKGFNTTRPSRVKRVNLFFYSGAQNLEFNGTLLTTGLWTSVFGPTLDLNSSVVDVNVLTNVQTNAANSAILSTLRTAWSSGAEIWLYACGGVPNDALAQMFATVMGAKVRAFTEPFWVLPRFDPLQKTILARDEFGIGADFAAASARRTKTLHTLDPLATRSFTP
ncbi:hypothetical protein AQUSIP_07700 [Aquicella siphonis]|uniref:Uncharacterized protein n=1 Tax=Aquicella siphonis TaxID=254247 RepID=A0A5E4PES5_9COXI|nr:hypothetical protein [Aquicella siphonis]VVC75480.1 hypothetical protein AQUSIP_07700 [Aquicella siphonis]